MAQLLWENLAASIDAMIRRAKTKLIAPVLTAGVLRRHLETEQVVFTEPEMRRAYEAEVCSLVRQLLHHNLHIGGEFEDAYVSRTLPKYGIVSPVGDRRYQLVPGLTDWANDAVCVIWDRIPSFIHEKLGSVLKFRVATERLSLASNPAAFAAHLAQEMQRSASHFEIISFAILKAHLERFACKLYRTLRTAAHDGGVDIATDFGAVYQVKKLALKSREDVEELYSELLSNFDPDRITDQKVVVVIDDVSPSCRRFLLDMRVQPIVRDDILALATLIEEPEDRQRVLRIVYDEFEREYRSDVCGACRVNPRIEGCQFIPRTPHRA